MVVAEPYVGQTIPPIQSQQLAEIGADVTLRLGVPLFVYKIASVYAEVMQVPGWRW
jgi:hypothetical protein